MSITIKNITAREILDSRGDPTVEVTAVASSGASATASVPSGASTGIHEAHELRDDDKNRYEGKGVLQAVAHIESEIKPTLMGMDVTNQGIIDQRMIELDGTATKHSLGANAILGVSLAVARLGALVSDLPLYVYLRQIFNLPSAAKTLPLPMMNILNGGRHASNDLDIQEFIIIPHLRVAKNLSLKDSVRIGSEIFHELGKVLHQKTFSTDVGNEGGYAPSLKSNEQALELITTAVKQAGYSLAKDVDLGLDVAASEFYKSGKYHFEGKNLSAQELIKIYQSWRDNYQLFSVEDGLAEDDWQGWHQLTEDLGAQVLLVGDDLFVTNKERLALGVEFKAANAVLIKPNQIGSLSEAVACVLAAKQANYKVVVSHRSGETMDTFIVDLAVAVGADYLKAGSTSRGERVVKYNRLMEIEEEMKS